MRFMLCSVLWAMAQGASALEPFQDVTEQMGFKDLSGDVAAWGDFDHDGRLDLIVSEFVDQSDTLYRNLGDKGFADVTSPSGIAKPSHPYVGWGTAFFDMDNSGWPYLAVRRLDPCPISWPKPRPWAVSSTKKAKALAEPNGASIPICSLVNTPISYSSMTAPTVAPKVIGSKPSSLQIRLANCKASRSLTPFAAPNAQAASYSKPPLAPQ